MRRIKFPDKKVQQDYEYLKVQVMGCYLELYGTPEPECSTWNLTDVWAVISFHFRLHYAIFGTAPQHIKNQGLKDIIESIDMVYGLGEHEGEFDVTPQDYFYMLQKYFKTEYKGCNYSLAHFMSGRVRLLKYYETVGNEYLPKDLEILLEDMVKE